MRLLQSDNAGQRGGAGKSTRVQQSLAGRMSNLQRHEWRKATVAWKAQVTCTKQRSWPSLHLPDEATMNCVVRGYHNELQE